LVEHAPRLVHERHSLISYARYLLPDVLAAALAAGKTFDLDAQALQASGNSPARSRASSSSVTQIR
jgi:hypothetical protein